MGPEVAPETRPSMPKHLVGSLNRSPQRNYLSHIIGRSIPEGSSSMTDQAYIGGEPVIFRENVTQATEVLVEQGHMATYYDLYHSPCTRFRVRSR